VPEYRDLLWEKSTFSSNGACVEVAFMDGRTLVRDSKNRQGAILEFTSAEWRAFLRGVQAGELGAGIAPDQ
jgi:hypothetical protein